MARRGENIYYQKAVYAVKNLMKEIKLTIEVYFFIGKPYKLTSKNFSKALYY